MPVHATGSCETQDWREKPYYEEDCEVRLSRSSLATVFHRDITGQGFAEYLMA